ncbi:MAG: HIRAN domain-containing protein [Betaproteobacteria bacterium]
MRSTLTLSLWLAAQLAWAGSAHLLVQSSPLAGSQYYAAGELWREMKVGDALTLTREPQNRHDAKAIRVEWRGHKLGYVPRAENRAVAAAMDAGERVSARISRLTDDPDPWRRVEFEVFLALDE